MTAFLQPVFWSGFLLFLLSIFLAFLVPGDVLLRKINLPIFPKIVLSIILGMVLWGYQGTIFGYLGLRYFSYFYIAIFLLLWLQLCFKKYLNLFHLKRKAVNLDYLLITIISLGVVIQLSAVWFNGVYLDKGLYFCCGNLYDSILHIALTNALVNQFPPDEPGMANITVQNYHYWGNLVLADLIRLFRLPLIPTQHQYSSIFLSFFLGLSAIVFGFVLGLGKAFIRWLTFFLYFGGDLVFLVVSLVRRELNFQMSSLEDGAKFLVNPPRAFSIIIFITGLTLFVLWLEKKDKYLGLLTVLIFASLIGFKVYTGFFALSGLSLLALYMLTKRQPRFSILSVATVILSFIIYFPVNINAGGLYFVGFSLFENFIVQPWMMLDYLEQARLIFYAHHNWLRVIQHELIYIALFIFAIFGTKLIGLFQTKNSLSKILHEVNIFLLAGISVSAIFGFFFQQKSGGANTFNFLVSIFIICSIYAALACSYWLSKIKNKIKYLIILLIIFLTIPRVISEAYINIAKIKNKQGFLIGNKELEGLKFLREKTEKNSLILVDYRWFKIDAESPYVSFLADRPMFLSGMGDELSAHGIDYSERKVIVDKVLKSDNLSEVGRTLIDNKIGYIYFFPQDHPKNTKFRCVTEIVFQNTEVAIAKVSQAKLNQYLKKTKAKQTNPLEECP